MSAAKKVAIDFAVVPEEWVRESLLIPIFGITPDMAKKYRDNGLWLQGKHYKLNPANRLVYNRVEINKWNAS